MLRRAWCAWTLALSMVLCSAAAAATRDGAVDERRNHTDGPIGERVAEAVRRAESREGFTGAVLAAIDGRVVAALGAGYADLARQTPNTPSTLFEIASLSKQFTAAAVLRLVEDRKVALSDSIAKHLPGVPENCRAITVEHLLRHTSGIPGTNTDGHGTELSAVLPGFLRGGPRHAPGTRWEYWNQGYALASEVVARASGRPFVEFSREEVFRRAGLKTAMFTGDEAPEGAVVAIGRSRMGPPRNALAHPYGDEFGFQYRGMGGVVTTVWDLWRWDRALSARATAGGGSALSASSIRSMFEPGLGEYGLGWLVRRDRGGRLVQLHGGGVRGFVCEMRRFPEREAVVIVLSNNDSVRVREVADAVTSALFDDDAGQRAGEIEADLAAALIGRYTDDGGRLLVVEEGAGGRLRALIHWAGEGRQPVTRAVLESDGRGGVVLDDTAERHAVKVERRGGAGASGPAMVLEIIGIRFTRK